MAYRFSFCDPWLEYLFQRLNSFHSPQLEFEAILSQKDIPELKDVIGTLAELFLSANREFDRKSFDHSWLASKGNILFCEEPARVRIAKMRDLCARFSMQCRDLQCVASSRSLMELRREVLSIGLHYHMVTKIADNDWIRLQGLMDPFFGTYRFV